MVAGVALRLQRLSGILVQGLLRVPLDSGAFGCYPGTDGGGLVLVP